MGRKPNKPKCDLQADAAELESTPQFISRHMPGRGAPQVPQPPEGASKDSELPACTAKAENSFSTRELLHFSQSIEWVFSETIFSNVAPHSKQRYS
jgi:hypothetical protein